MKRCGIITIFKKSDEPNYGNILQLYALNTYLNINSENVDFETLYFLDNARKKYIGTFSGCAKRWLLLKILKLKKYKSRQTKAFKEIIEQRKKSFYQFLCNNDVKITEVSCKDIMGDGFGNFQAFIVGSDVVWGQTANGINPVRFLMFGGNKIKRYSYAASFGNNAIPKDNVKAVVRALKQFDKISVRERDAVKMLNKLGVNDVKHVLDPTFLIEKERWINLCEKPINLNESDKFIFLYILGENDSVFDEIKLLAKKNSLKVVLISYANGYYRKQDYYKGFTILDACSPENFLWLINNSKLVVTDSFHGMALSTNLEKEFIALRREGKTNINSRILDFLKISNQEYRMHSVTELEAYNLSDAYKKHNENNIHKYCEYSKQYLYEVINGVE